MTPSNYGLDGASFHELDQIKEARRSAWQHAVREAYGDEEELAFETLEEWQDALRSWAVESNEFSSDEALTISSQSDAVRPFVNAVERATRAKVEELERTRGQGTLVTPSWDKATRKAIEKNLEKLQEAEAEAPAKDPTPIIRTSIQPKK